ncbi:MAG: DEAD/DEAH box helicase family protein [Lentisphaeria bacterium]|nr:DEAD/DEAH box helicase family protein [Lentisphaeria bacterium]
MTNNLLRFDAGTLLLELANIADFPFELAGVFKHDPRTGNFRARACDYARIVLTLKRKDFPFTDRARDYANLDTLVLKEEITPHPHQHFALEKWLAHSGRGVVSLPTGAGKTILAVLAISRIRRPALVLVPTIDLLTQWATVLERFFPVPVGMLGGGSHDIQNLTVSTYDSVVLNMEFIGNRFGLLIADECHHLPGPGYQLSAAMAIAPFRLGLSATPEMDAERAATLRELMGETVCHVGIDELEGKVLSHYQVKRMFVQLNAEEEQLYRKQRAIYTAFLRRFGINFASRCGWRDFLIACSRFPGGKEAFAAFLEQRKIARAGRAKLELLENILLSHPGERIIIFTADNDTAYSIGRRFTFPVVTHHTRSAERKAFLDAFRTGEYPVLVTSKVLNEGVDIPSAAVGVVFSGSGSVREHVQRLGRILRPSPGKNQAMLYELVSAGTSEEYTSGRRREHQAYRQRR